MPTTVQPESALAPTCEEMGRFNLPIACSMVRNLPVEISPIYMKNDLVHDVLKSKIRCFVLIKINLIFEGVFYILTCVSTPENVPFEHVLTQENYNSEAYAIAS